MDEIIGYRAWEEKYLSTWRNPDTLVVSYKELGLSSVSFPHFWAAGQTKKCECIGLGLEEGHRRKLISLWPPLLEEPIPPFYNCQCGVYAYRELSRLQKELTPQPFRILGEVSLWGKIIEHEDGYRAQYAYPRRFFYSNVSSNEELARKYANIFGVEVSPL